MPQRTVAKFGGTSVRDAPEKVIKISKEPGRDVIVVSCPKVTDYLIKLATGDLSVIDPIIHNFRNFTNEDQRNQIKKRIENTLSANYVNKTIRTDTITVLGETITAELLAPLIGAEYIPAQEIIKIDENRKVLPQSNQLIQQRLHLNGKKYIIDGFQGSTTKGDLTAMERDASDKSAIAVAKALNKTCEIFTDVEGIYSVNPTYVDNPKMIDEMNYFEALDLCYRGGFKVVQWEALEQLIDESEIDIVVKSTWNPTGKGTRITPQRVVNKNQPLTGIGFKDNYISLDIIINKVRDQVGIYLDICTVLKDHNISFSYPTGVDNDIGILIKKEENHTTAIYNSVIKEIEQKIKGAKGTITHDLGCLLIAGAGLKGNIGIGEKILHTFREQNINNRATSQGPSERCIIYAIKGNRGKDAVQALYKRFLA